MKIKVVFETVVKLRKTANLRLLALFTSFLQKKNVKLFFLRSIAAASSFSPLMFQSLPAEESRLPLEEKINGIKNALSTPYVYHSVNVITGEYCESEVDMRLNGPIPLDLRRCYFSSAPTSWNFNLPSLNGQSALFPEGSTDDGPMRYRFDQQNRLDSVEIINPNTQEVLRWLAFHYDEGQQFQYEVRSDDGRAIHYSFKEVGPTRSKEKYVLESVTMGDQLICNYQYCDHPFQRKKMIAQRNEPNKRYLINEYYDSKHNKVGTQSVYIADPIRDHRIGKVKLQKAPLGVDEEAHIFARFFYYPGYTEVFNALDDKTIYRYSKEKQLTAIENYLHPSKEEYQLHRIERFYWNKQQQLVSRTVEDHNQQILRCQTFEYNNKGKLVCESLFGNLSGTCSRPLILEKSGLPVKNGVECYCTYYQYDEKNPHLLVEQRGDNGMKIRYCYDNDQLRAIFFYDGDKISVRHFYSYSQFGTPACLIIDDGYSEEKTNLAGVTERHETEIISRAQHPGIGLSETIEEYYVDLTSGKRKLLKKIYHHYSECGKLTQQDIYDGAGSFCSSLTYQYDEFERPIQIGQSEDNFQTLAYDLNGNLIAKNDKKGATTYQYDYANRVISKDEHLANGMSFHNQFKHDFNHNCISSIDLFGHETTYQYDALNRLTKICYPAVPNEKGVLIHPMEQREYDTFDRIIAAVDANGAVTRTEYNLYGKPIHILYPDGSEEKFTYNLDGTLKSGKNRAGLTTSYRYDFLGRVKEEKVAAPSGKIIRLDQTAYNAFHKLSETTANGLTVCYEYDHAGRQTAILRHVENGILRTEFIYNEAGNLVTKKEFYGSKSNEVRVTHLSYDQQNQITGLELQNDQEQLLRRVVPAQEDMEELAVVYQYDAINSWGQNVLQKTITSTNGNLMIYLYDALGRVEKITVNNPLGKPISQRQFVYDAAGNRVQEQHQVYLENQWINESTIAKEYDACRHAISITEAFGTNQQRTAYYRYHHSGNLSQQIKPDGVSLDYSYGECGKLARLHSSDGTVDYRYYYDANGNLASVEDCVELTQTSRTYNSFNAVISEQQSNGLHTESAYDLLGRRTEISFSDGSSVTYCYDPVSLKSIERLSSQKKVLYTHQYLDYSPEGELKKSQLIGNLGPLTFQRDHHRRMSEILSPFWSQKIDSKGYDQTGKITGFQVTDFVGSYQETFAYQENEQLSQEKGCFKGSYLHDSLYNRHSYNDKWYRYDALQQLCQAGESVYDYDFNGNLIESKEPEAVTYYRYDALDRLIEVIQPERLRVCYKYDSFNRRMSKQIFEWRHGRWQAQAKLLFLYDGDCEIGAVNEQGKIEQLRVLGIGRGAEIGAAVAVELGGSVYAPIHDYRGSVSALVDLKTAKTVECYRYSAFGEEKIYNGAGNLSIRSQLNNPWRYASKRSDDETNFVYFGRRYYSSKAGRWLTKDPMGFPDSPNRYAYALNNPLTYLDLHGHFSFSNLLRDVVHALQSAYEFTSFLSSTLQSHFSCGREVKSFLTDVVPQLIDKPILYLAGFNSTQSECGVYGQWECSDKVRITMINGILNARIDYRNTLNLVSRYHGNNNIHFVFDASQGWTSDLVKGLLVKMGVVTPEAKMLAALWKELIKEMGGAGGDGLIIHYAHSLGGTQTECAKQLLTPEEQKMIRIITFASASVLENQGFENVTNYVSVRDIVYLVDPLAYLKCLFYGNDAINFVGSWFGIPLGDHMLFSGTYDRLLRELGLTFQESYI